MKSIVKNSIEYSGIMNDISQLKHCHYLKHIILEENIVIPDNKPNVDKIIKVTSAVRKLNTRILSTPILVSLSGQNLSGKKLFIEGEVNQKIEYMANTAGCELHAEYSVTPFSLSIILPYEFKFSASVSAAGYICDAYVSLINNSKLYKSINLLIAAEY